MIYGIYDTKDIRKEYNKLKSPKEYDLIDLDQLFTNDYSLYMSTRQDGKTTDALLKGIILNKLYGVKMVYLRNDTTQITLSNVSSLFDTVKIYGYIEKLFDGLYNDIIYVNRERNFYFVHKDENGEIDSKAVEPFCFAASNENWLRYKSTKNLPTAWYILWDEFLDTERFASPLVSEAFNNISTFTRTNENAHVVGISNTINPYSVVFEDLCISEDVCFMDFGDEKNIKTQLGTTLYIKLLSLSKKKKIDLKEKTVRFFGFNNKKFANFTGLQAWQGREYRHLHETPIHQEIIYHIKHRDKYIAVNLVEIEDKLPIFLLTKCSYIPDNRGVILTEKPELVNEMRLNAYDFSPLIDAVRENRICVTTNQIGLLFDDFLSCFGYKMS